jgi:hypothetical protein
MPRKITERGRARKIWSEMIRRCGSPTAKSYKYYGARGIRVCIRWKLFENFFADMGVPPVGLSLERRNNDGPYSPDNCHWATHKEQMRNTRSNRWITFRGETLILEDMASTYGLDPLLVWKRLHRGWATKKALTKPPRSRPTRLLTFQGRTQSLRGWARELGIDDSTLAARLRTMSLERALTHVKGQQTYRRGEDHYATTLSNKQVMEILASNASTNQLAKDYHVSRATIYRIRHRKTRLEASA